VKADHTVSVKFGQCVSEVLGSVRVPVRSHLIAEIRSPKELQLEFAQEVSDQKFAILVGIAPADLLIAK
jgi:hypothetical protein